MHVWGRLLQVEGQNNFEINLGAAFQQREWPKMQ